MKFLQKSKSVLLLAVIFSFCAAVAYAADPVVVELHYQNGVKFYKRGLYDRAIKELEKTLSLDPSHAEAKEYLDKVKQEKDSLTRVESKKSQEVELKSLYAEGKRLYKERDYKGAIDIFDMILKKKPVDDFASYYKERCEILIARKLAKEKKIEEKNKAKEKVANDRANRRKEKEDKRQKRKKISQESRKIDQERRNAKEDRVSEALRQMGGEETKQDIKNSRRAQKEERREARIMAKEDKRAEVLKRKEEKRAAALKRKEEKLRAKEERRSLKRGKKLKIEETEGTPDVLKNKETFVKGVEQYGRREYEAAIDSFRAVIDAESSGRKLYTNSANRLMGKAQQKLKAGER